MNNTGKANMLCYPYLQRHVSHQIVDEAYMQRMTRGIIRNGLMVLSSPDAPDMDLILLACIDRVCAIMY